MKLRIINIKTILAAFALAGLATTAPSETLEKRAYLAGQNRFCYNLFFLFNFLFIRGVGSGCIDIFHVYISGVLIEYILISLVPPSNLPCSTGNRPLDKVCYASNLPLVRLSFGLYKWVFINYKRIAEIWSV